MHHRVTLREPIQSGRKIPVTSPDTASKFVLAQLFDDAPPTNPTVAPVIVIFIAVSVR